MRTTLALACGTLLCAALGAAEAPEVVHVGTVAPDVLGLTLRAGHVEYGRQVSYEPQPGDRVDRSGHQRWVYREGKYLGSLVGEEGRIVYTPDRRVGPRLDTAWADRPASYRLVSTDDPRYADGLRPTAVHRKSKPSDLARVGPWQFRAPMLHVIYLRLPQPLAEGKSYTLRFDGAALPQQSFVWAPRRMRSEAVHVSHLGFRPDDPAKVAFLSCWLGTGGGLVYKEGLRFEVLDAEGDSVFQGAARLAKAAGEPEDVYKKNYNGTDVYELDFSPLARRGTYRVCVEGVGCSYPFVVADDAWRRAFFVSARGFYHQRSGIALGPPHTTFQRPRCFHPEDGLKVYHSTCPLMDSGNGLNRKDSNFGNLNKGRTDQLVADAWGGLMDAGDWDRRIQHLVVSRLLLELAGLFPDYFADLALNIPESSDGLPDVVNEALWNLDGYRRMQTAEGGIRGGIESAEHPRHGEGSWQESLPVMAYAPGIWSSYVYAGVAARAAHWLMPRHHELWDLYQESALRAMRWAEKELEAAGERQFPIEVRDARNLAAIELYRLTGEARWRDLFLATTFFKEPEAPLWEWRSHDQRDAAWVVLRLQRPGIPDAVKATCLRATRAEADERAAGCARTGFRWTKHAWRPVGWGCLAAPDAVTLVRAHALTGEPKYLRAALLACQAGGGANPTNVCYTTGLGHRSPRHPLHIDSRITDQPPPAGLTVFGPHDVERAKGQWGQKLVARFASPPPERWPTIEAWWDVFWYPAVCEFTVQTPMAANAYVWGYLAARE
ncbi:MAG: glycoside hydrolase family 9 protein [Candidatus Brocadiia bacterium]